MFFISANKGMFQKRNKTSGVNEVKKRKKLIIFLSFGIMLISVSIWVLYASLHMPCRSFCEKVGEYSLSAQTQKEREEFFLPFGYKAKSLENIEITIPSQGKIFEQYNEIQKRQGLNLSPYTGKKAQMYVLSLEGEAENTLYGFLMVYRGRVIGGHMSDCMYPAQIMGFMEY